MADRSALMARRGANRGFYAFVVLALACAFAIPSLAKIPVARKKQIARTAFDDAERMREALNGRPVAGRTVLQYQRVIDAYRKVYYTAPNSIKAEPAIVAVAELLAEQGRNFNNDKLLQSAIGQYEFLRREYPGSKRRAAVLFAEGQIYADDLDDAAHARQTFEEYLKRYPRSELADDAHKAIAALDADAAAARKSPGSKRQVAEKKKPDVETLLATPPANKRPDVETPQTASPVTSRKAEAPAAEPGKRADLPPAVRAAAEQADAAVDKLDGKSAKPESTKAASAAPEKQAAPAQTVAEAPRKGKLPLVTGIRHWSTPDYTRIAVDLEQEVTYEVGRIPDPDRLFFDLHGTKLAPGLMGKEFEVEDGLLKKIRVAQFQVGETRIVFDLGDIADYQAFLLPNPYRLIVDVHGKKKAAAVASKTPPAPDISCKDGTCRVALPAAPSPATSVSAGKRDAPRSDVAKADVPRELPKSNARKPDVAPASSAPPVVKPAADSAKTDSAKTDSAKSDSAKPGSAKSDSAKSDTPDTTFVATSTKPDSSADPVSTDKTSSRDTASTSRKPARSATTREARPTSSGDRSLIRALGLKIGRIVVDAGHGGHDTGTIGPSGLLEKDLVLEVAQRLGKLLEARMGAEVVYTRDDDTFIPLETRTAIANREQADLFISVHANSSRDAKARGVETYYLNFTTSADALEVAARENAVSDTSIHELQDLVKKIALKEKVEESREFASDVQQSLKSGLSGRGSTMRDRGVRKAPFIVLIGANMPSILAEVSFLSNPADERKLKTPDYRQKIAESLYRGVARYVSGLSGIKVAANATKATGE